MKPTTNGRGKKRAVLRKEKKMILKDGCGVIVHHLPFSSVSACGNGYLCGKCRERIAEINRELKELEKWKKQI